MWVAYKNGIVSANATEKPKILYPNRQKQTEFVRTRRPFWLPASNYYVLTAAVAIGFFFLFWGALQDSEIETPWIPSGVGASIILFGAVILREVILRRARNQYLKFESRLDRNLNKAYSQIGGRQISENRNKKKLTVEKNASILREIKQKSDAANVLAKFSAGHREVFEYCGEYIALNERELQTVGPGSPRIGALLKGRSSANEYHRYHLLKWAEIETRSLTNEAKNKTKTNERVEASEKALHVIQSALEFYPEEESLLESRNVLLELIASIKVSGWVEKAERATFKGDYKRAISLYRDALFYLSRDNILSENRASAEQHINAEIERIKSIANYE